MKWWMKRKSDSTKIAFYLLYIFLCQYMKELELGIEDIPEGLLEDFSSGERLSDWV